MGYIIKSIIKFILNIFTEVVENDDNERYTEQSVYHVVENEISNLIRKRNATLQAPNHRPPKSNISWDEFKRENAIVNNYFASKEVMLR